MSTVLVISTTSYGCPKQRYHCSTASDRSGQKTALTRDTEVSSLPRAVPVPAVVLGGCTG